MITGGSLITILVALTSSSDSRLGLARLLLALVAIAIIVVAVSGCVALVGIGRAVRVYRQSSVRCSWIGTLVRAALVALIVLCYIQL